MSNPMKPFEDYYEILQVHHSAEPIIVQAAYRKLAQKYHPDIDKSPSAVERMKKINIAYEILSNPEKRKSYDIQWRKEQATTHETLKRNPESQKEPLNREYTVKQAPTWEYKKTKSPPFTVKRETDKIKIETCPDCGEDTLCYFKPMGPRDKGEYRCSNEAYYSHPYLDKYLKG